MLGKGTTCETSAVRPTSENFGGLALRPISLCGQPKATRYAALTRFRRAKRGLVRAKRELVGICLLALKAARRRSSSNSRSFADILGLLIFRWADIFSSLDLSLDIVNIR